MKVVKLLISLCLSISTALGQTNDGLIKANGTQLYVKSVGVGEPILVVHGGPGMNHSYFIPHLNPLSKDHQIIYYDQRASGKSSLSSIDSISIASFVEDIDAVRKHFNKEKLYIMAHSWGIIPAVNYAIRFPDKVKGIIFCNAIPLSKEFETEIRNTQLDKSSGLDSTDYSIIVGSPNFKAGKSSAYKKLLLLSFRNSFYKASNSSKLSFTLRDNYRESSKMLYAGLSKDLEQYDYYEDIKRFTFPVLVLHGAADIVPLASDQMAVDNIPNATLEIFKKSGHFIFIEENKKFTTEVKKFIK